ncbi:MAG TPA: hypothetical protein VGE50_05725 [Gammaproteobacteria bacterium]
MYKASVVIASLALLTLTACSQDDNKPHQTIPVTQSQGEKPLGVVVARALPNEPPQNGSCIGWRRGLAKGNEENTLQVQKCLRALATSQRSKAVEQARQLSGWQLKDDPQFELRELVNTLVAFPEEGQLKAYLDQLGVLTPSRADDSSTAADEPPLTPRDYLLQQGRVYGFDVETGLFPNRHDELLASLAQLSNSELRAAKFQEIPPSDYDAEDEPYTLIGIIGDKKYEMSAENYGDWYDLDAVLALLNQMANENSIADRFVTLPTEDQTAIVLVITTDALTSLTEKQLLNISDADLARVQGKAAEQAMIEAIEKGDTEEH